MEDFHYPLPKSMTNKDVRWAGKINGGDQAAWEKFIKAYSPWVLYKARVWCGHDCFLPRETACCLIALSRSLETNQMPGNSCDEGMDIYVWIFGELRKRIGKFSGRNGSSLSTYVWSILNSRGLYIDWLRDKYGRIV